MRLEILADVMKPGAPVRRFSLGPPRTAGPNAPRKPSRDYRDKEGFSRKYSARKPGRELPKHAGKSPQCSQRRRVLPLTKQDPMHRDVCNSEDWSWCRDRAKKNLYAGAPKARFSRSCRVDPSSWRFKDDAALSYGPLCQRAGVVWQKSYRTKQDEEVAKQQDGPRRSSASISGKTAQVGHNICYRT